MSVPGHNTNNKVDNLTSSRHNITEEHREPHRNGMSARNEANSPATHTDKPGNFTRTPRDYLGFRRNPSTDRESSSTPLLNLGKAALATPEVDEAEDEDDREVVHRPYPGVDDGFFSNGDDVDEKKEIPDVEAVPTAPPEIIPDLSPRFGGDDEDEKPDREDGNDKDDKGDHDKGDGEGDGIDGPVYRFSPGFGVGIDVEGQGGFAGSTPDVNVYQQKKTLAQGMMDLALLSANANQLRYVLESYDRHPYFYPSLIFLALSLILQIAVGVGLIWNATYNVKDEREICIANRINNFTVSGIFLVTVVNVFISAFGVAAPPVPSNT